MGGDVRSQVTFCRVCTAACGLIAEVRGEEVLRVRGDVDHPLSQGYTCAKGRALPRAHHDPQRLDRPLLRVAGELVPVEWDHVLDDAADRIRAVVDEHGPSAVGIFLGGGGYMDASGYYLARALPRILGTPAFYSDLTIDVPSKPYVSELVAGLAGQMSRPDYDRCALVVYVGSNPVVSHGHTSMLVNPVVRLRELLEQGEVWVIDPRRTETAALSTGHLAPRAGTDHAVVAHLIRELLLEGADHEHLRAHAQGVEELAAAVEPFNRERTAELCDLDPTALDALLDAIRRAGRLAVETGTGISMGPSANVTQWLTWALMVVTGSLDQPGGAWVHPGFYFQLEDLELPVAPPEGCPTPGPASRPELSGFLGEYPCSAMADEIAAGHLRVLLDFGGNLVACLPETDKTVAALSKLEVLLTLDVEANETTALATHVFASKGQLERPDLPYVLDIAYPVLGTQYSPAVVAPFGDRRSMWWSLLQLFGRLGHELLPGIDPDVASDDDVLAVIARSGRIDHELVRESGRFVQLDGPPPLGWLQRHVDRGGGWRLAPAPLVAQLEALADPPPLVLVPRRQPKHINARFRDLGDRPDILVSEPDALAARVRDGDQVTVRSAYGELTGTARVDPSIRRGAVSVPHGWPEPHNVNRLTSADLVDPLTGMPRYSGIPVELQLADTMGT